MMNPMAAMEKVPAYNTWGNSQKPQVVSYTFTGPTTGSVSVQSTAFTVAIPTTVSTPQDIHITPSDGTGGGTFQPTSVILNSDQPSTTFKYTPNAVAEAKILSVANDRGLTNPANITYTTS